MKRLSAGLSVAALLFVTGCSSDSNDGSEDSGSATPEALCKSVMADTCSKMFDCYDGVASFPEKYGNNKDECQPMLEAKNCGSDTVKCESGTTFHASKASECLSQVKAVTCEQYMNKTNEPTACEDVCM